MTKFLIGGLVILILILVILVFVRSSSGPRKNSSQPPLLLAPSTSSVAVSSPSINPFAKMPIFASASAIPLEIISVEPKEDLSQEYNRVTQVKFIFSDDIDLDNFLLEISPGSKVTILPGSTPHVYIISPNTFWPQGISTFTIKQGTKSLKGATLNSTFIYKINFQDPKNPPDDTEL